MAVTPGKVQFEDDDGNTLEVDLPLYPYVTTIDLPFEVQKLENGTYDIYDHAGGTPDTYDIRSCRCTFELTASEMALFNAFFSEDDQTTTKARGFDVTLRMNTNSGFHPFGPDKGDAGDFDVALIIASHGEVGEEPIGYFHVVVDMVNTGSWPTYSMPAEVADGSFTFGTVTSVRFPPQWFKPDVEYRVYRTTEQDGTVRWIDRGQAGDWFESSFELHANESKMGRVVAYLVNTARTAAFQVVAPAAGITGYYVFGYDKGSAGTYNVKLIQDTLKITHDRYNHFKVPLSLTWVSTA